MAEGRAMSEKISSDSFSVHLAELRTRLIRCFVFVGIAFAISYYFSDLVYAALTLPLDKALKASGRATSELQYTQLYEAFFTYIKVSLFSGFCLAFPFIAGQLWRFVSPGLYQKERRVFLPYIIISPILFVLGGLLVYFAILPLAISFFLGFENSGEVAQWGIQVAFHGKVNEYLSLVMLLILGFGLSFQLPVVLSLLCRVGIITGETLKKNRKYALALILILAAVATPPDIISQLVLGVPLYGLYELSIVLSRWYTPFSLQK